MLTNACFISYRREVGEWVARSVFEELRDNEIDAFLDVEDIRAGDVLQIIEAQIRRRPYFLLVLTPLTLVRCREPEDVLLMEIDTAVAAGCRLIPLQTERYQRQEITDCLPDRLSSKVKYANAVPFSSAFFKASIDTLKKFLTPVEVAMPYLDRNLAAGAERLLEQAKQQPRIEPNVLAAQTHLEEALTLNSSGASDEKIDGELKQMAALLGETQDATRWKAEADRRLANLASYYEQNARITDRLLKIAEEHHQAAMKIARNLRS